MDEQTDDVIGPPFDEALSAWTSFLAEQGLPTELSWVFDENVVRVPVEGTLYFTPSFQVELDAPQPEYARIAYEYFAATPWPVVFRAVGTSASKCLCMILCDDWFEGDDEDLGVRYRKPWHMYFDAGSGEEVGEVRDRGAWRRLKARTQALSDLDFGMTLQAVRELQQHGRILPPWQRALNAVTSALKSRGGDAQAV